MLNKKVIIASAGSGKTRMIIEEALKIEDESVLITTFTDANEEHIRNKIIAKKGYIPKNITIQTWFSFLLEHGVKPFQNILNEDLWDRNIGFRMVDGGQSGLKYNKEGETIKMKNGLLMVWGEEKNLVKHYFDNIYQIYSDKIAKFSYKTDINSKGLVIGRLSKIFKHIFIDEIQDFAGYDLEIFRLLINSDLNILFIGDIRQAVYSTNNSRKNKKQKGSDIIDFFRELYKKGSIELDETSLTENYRSSKEICEFSNLFFSDLQKTEAVNEFNTGHDGIFYIKENDIDKYLANFPDCVQLRYSSSTNGIRENYKVFNFGISKGLEFDRVLIFPTKGMKDWIQDNNKTLPNETKAKFYVAITRAKYSVAIVYDYKDSEKFKIGKIYTF